MSGIGRLLDDGHVPCYNRLFVAGRETFVVACIVGSINCYVSGCLYVLGTTADVAISFRSSIRYTKPRLNFLLQFKISRIMDVTL